MANFWPAFWTYLRWSLEFLFASPFIFGTLLLVLNFVAAVFRQRPFHTPIWKQTYTIIIVQFLFFPATLAVAVIGRVDWQQPHYAGPNHWALQAENAFAIGSLLVSGYWVWRMKGLRWFAVSLALLQLLLLAAANFIAGMSLTGDWL